MVQWLAVWPVLAVLAGLWGGLSSLRAALLSLAVAWAGVSWLVWAGWPLPHGLVVAQAAWQWLPVMLEVLGIIGGGLALSQCLQAGGAQFALVSALRRRMGLERTAGAVHASAVLLVVHGVTPFAESVTGFGIGVTVGIPMLRQLGVPPVRAAWVGLLGLCAVPWGSMGPGTLVAARMAGLPLDALGLASAWCSALPFAVAGVAAVWAVAPQDGGMRWRAMGQAVASALVLWGGVLAANALLGTALAGAVGALCVLAWHLAWGPRWQLAGRVALSHRAALALRAYALVLGGVLLGRGVRAWALAGDASGMAQLAADVLASPACWLWIATGYAVRVLRPVGAAHAAVLLRTLVRGVGPSWAAVGAVAVAYIALGLTLGLSGMAARLAEGLVGLGRGYVLAAPFVAAMGGFVTGSNTATNAMLADTQARMALQLGVPLLPFMAVHNVAAALLMMAAPAKVEMALHLANVSAADARARTVVQRATLLAAAPSLLGLALYNAWRVG